MKSANLISARNKVAIILLTLFMLQFLIACDMILIDPGSDYNATEEVKKAQEKWKNNFGKEANDKNGELGLKIYQTKRTLMHDEYGNIAEDLLYADKTDDKILEMKNMKPTDFFLSPIEHQKNWELTCKNFSTEPLQSVILDMVDNFMTRRDEIYENPILTEQAKNHLSTIEYVEFIKLAVDELLKEYNGDITKLEYVEDSREKSLLVKKMLDKTGKVREEAEAPVFNTLQDEIDGLKIAVNSLWGNEIVVKDYKLNGGEYKITLAFTLYDHFGLDVDDMEKRLISRVDVDWIALDSGFRSWYILQHYDGYQGVYRPFVTIMSFDVTFTGRIN